MTHYYKLSSFSDMLDKVKEFADENNLNHDDICVRIEPDMNDSILLVCHSNERHRTFATGLNSENIIRPKYSWMDKSDKVEG